MGDWFPSVLSFLLSFMLVLGLTPLARRLGVRAGWSYRRPDPRHIHTRPTPRSGGLAMVLAMAAAWMAVLWLPSARPVGEVLRVGLLLIGSLLTFGLILWDDVREMAPLPKLAIQFAVAALAIGPYFLAPELEPPPGLVITQVQNPLGGTLYLPMGLAVAFTFLWIVGMMNTTNLLDGLDGLAAGVSAIAALLLFVHTIRLGQFSLAPLPLAVAGACLGFLPYNFHPARIFMGDSGAMLLGYALAIVSIVGGAKMATALLVLGIPILDGVWMVIFRLSRGRSPMRADRAHLHHRLLDLGLSQVQIVGLFYGVCALFGLLALVLPAGRYKLYALVGMGVGLGILLWWLARRQLDRGEGAP